MGDYQLEKLLIGAILVIVLFIVLSKPNVNTGGDSNRLRTLPIALAIGTGDATNSILQGGGTGAVCPHCGEPLR